MAEQGGPDGPGDAAHRAWSADQFRRQVAFIGGAVDPRGGFGYLDEHGELMPERDRELFITCRMTYVASLAVLHTGGGPSAEGPAALAAHGVQALTGPFADDENGGWYSALDSRDVPRPGRKEAYGHAFVLLAASAATAAGAPGARDLLHAAVRILDTHFWDPIVGAVRESFAVDFSDDEPYRGANSNMHSVEALLAAADVIGDGGPLSSWELRHRALRICELLIDRRARANGWSLPEHFDTDWQPLLDHNRDEPAHPFRPYGSTVGHWFEWARLLVQLDAALDGTGPDWLTAAAIEMTDHGLATGWAVDGSDGFAYTVDWDGAVMVGSRMHWVLTEAIAAVAVLYRVTGEVRYRDWFRRLWDHAEAHFVEAERGTWIHQLDTDLNEDGSVWPGRPDAYHVAGALLIPSLPVRGSLLTSLADARR